MTRRRHITRVPNKRKARENPVSVYSGAMNVTVSSRGKPPTVAKALPISLDLSKQDATIGDVKRAIAKKFPKVSLFTRYYVLKVSQKRYV